MKTVTLKLPDDLHAILIATARRRHTSKSDVVRQAIEAYLNGGGAVPRGSLVELAADLIGSVEGPGDLSHNPKYLDDLGQ